MDGGSFIGTPVDPKIKDAVIAANKPFKVDDNDNSAMHNNNVTRTKATKTIITVAVLIPNRSKYFIFYCANQDAGFFVILVKRKWLGSARMQQWSSQFWLLRVSMPFFCCK